MYLQTDEQLNPISAWGCWFITILSIIEKSLNREFEIREILDLFYKAVLSGAIVDDPATTEIDIANTDAAKILDMIPGHGLIYIGEAHLSYTCQPNEYEGLSFEYTASNGSHYKHFVQGDGQGNCAFDPLGHSNCVAKGSLTGKFLFRKSI